MSHENVTARKGDIFSPMTRMKESTKYRIAAIAAVGAVIAFGATCLYSIFQ